MLKIRKPQFFAVALCLFSAACSSPQPKAELTLAPQKLVVGEGMANPIGYYETKPRFSWKLPSNGSIQSQSAYQIQVASSVDKLQTKADLWDSGKVEDSQTAWVRYQGEPLKSRQKVFWRVKVWDEKDTGSEWSSFQSIELGLLDNNDWQAKWIGHPDTELSQSPSQALIATPQYLRKSFSINRQLKKARLYITAKGLFTPYINGQNVAGDDVMTPGWTPYQKRIETLTYDVTPYLMSGENTLAASLAGGWYSGRVFKVTETEFKLPPRLLAQLELTYDNGQIDVITSDNSWLATQQGPIRFASIYDGEHYEQELEMPGWSKNQFDTRAWQQVATNALDSQVALKPKRHTTVRTTQRLPVTDIVSVEGNTALFDFGQNMVGVPQLNLPVKAGQEVKIRFAEALHKGKFYTDNYRSAVSTDVIMPSKDGILSYTPTYTYHGYRYIEVSGYDANQTPSKDWLTALVQHSDMTLFNNFQSSHKKLNQLSRNIVWGLRSNFFDIPLDCPQRDERLGWTGDAQVFVTPSMYMADVYGFWAAWLESIREEQGADGKIPLYIPFVESINFASSGWGDAATIIPWELYQFTGDKTILEDNYDMMKGWVNYHQKKSDKLISTMTTFGDWLQPFPLAEGKMKNRGDTDFGLIGTAYFARSIELTLATAKVLNHTDDIAALTELHQQVKTAFQQTYFDKDLNMLKGQPTQTSYLLGLAYDLFAEEDLALALDKLIEQISKADNHLRTGFLGTPLLTSVLQEAGRSDLIYELLFKETYPSWFYSINNGATTTWERWNSYSLEEGFNPEGMNSLNHYAYGTVSRWFYEGILGITPTKPGFSSVQIAPQFSTKLSSANGSLTTPQGNLAVDWKVDNKQLTLTVIIPPNTKADIVLPNVTALTINGSPFTMKSLMAGQYTIKGELNIPELSNSAEKH
ncbi:family 78 glycoside hydrolase catalytic domain [Pseudomonadota bacterium]